MNSEESITTDRLIIRPLRKEDFRTWSEAIPVANARSLSNIEKTVPSSQRSFTDFQQRLKYYKKLREKDRVYHFAIFDRTNPSKMVGSLSLTILERLIVQRAAIGYHIFTDYLRQGYGTESVKAVLFFAFKELKLHRIEALIETKNRASASLALAVGMKKEGTLRKALFSESSAGKWVDALLFAAVAEDFGIKGMKPSVRLEIRDH